MMLKSLNFVCGTLGLFLLRALNSTNIPNASVGLNSKYEHPSSMRIGTAIIKRETKITRMPRLNAKSHFCGLPSKAVDRICRAIIEIHQSISNQFTYNMLKDISAGECELRLAEFGSTNANFGEVYVRACPIQPELYVSQGNKAGWVILFTPNRKLDGLLKTLVHLGPFDSVLYHRTKLISKYLMKPMKVPLI